MFKPRDRWFIYQICQAVKSESIIDERDAKEALSLYIEARRCAFDGPDINYQEIERPPEVQVVSKTPPPSSQEALRLSEQEWDQILRWGEVNHFFKEREASFLRDMRDYDPENRVLSKGQIGWAISLVQRAKSRGFSFK